MMLRPGGLPARARRRARLGALDAGQVALLVAALDDALLVEGVPRAVHGGRRAAPVQPPLVVARRAQVVDGVEHVDVVEDLAADDGPPQRHLRTRRALGARAHDLLERVRAHGFFFEGGVFRSGGWCCCSRRGSGEVRVGLFRSRRPALYLGKTAWPLTCAWSLVVRASLYRLSRCWRRRNRDPPRHLSLWLAHKVRRPETQPRQCIKRATPHRKTKVPALHGSCLLVRATRPHLRG
ncbi:hypothetical protein EDB80DRAFT_276783 [Ilyonectria destructans]|nr:hypothetical protein EDB80DRAFT_276783 [Ilyonectria destructans]